MLEGCRALGSDEGDSRDGKGLLQPSVLFVSLVFRSDMVKYEECGGSWSAIVLLCLEASKPAHEVSADAHRVHSESVAALKAGASQKLGPSTACLFGVVSYKSSL